MLAEPLAETLQVIAVLGVIAVQAERLDSAYLRHWAAELGVSDLLERAFDEGSRR